MENLRTLLFLVTEEQVLLAMKKRGFGAGRWNGVGGKLEPGESIEEATIRECQEEIGVTPKSLTKVAIHDFLFPDGQLSMQAHTYICTEWEGDPIETEEMNPAWFAKDNVPYHDMWQDDIYWLPAVLAGHLIKTAFTFDTQDNLTKAVILPVESFDTAA